MLFPVAYNDRKRFKMVFRRIRAAINLWERADTEVVAYDEEIKFLDRFENGEFEERIENLILYGVKFKACRVAMKMYEVSEEALFDGVETVRSGFEYHILKVREGYIPIYL
ncbi:MAG: DsrE family protein [Aquificota bacterium]|nr:DsrE family protein [Aquificota bacterium]